MTDRDHAIELLRKRFPDPESKSTYLGIPVDITWDKEDLMRVIRAAHEKYNMLADIVNKCERFVL